MSLYSSPCTKNGVLHCYSLLCKLVTWKTLESVEVVKTRSRGNRKDWREKQEQMKTKTQTPQKYKLSNPLTAPFPSFPLKQDQEITTEPWTGELLFKKVMGLQNKQLMQYRGVFSQTILWYVFTFILKRYRRIERISAWFRMAFFVFLTSTSKSPIYILLKRLTTYPALVAGDLDFHFENLSTLTF